MEILSDQDLIIRACNRRAVLRMMGLTFDGEYDALGEFIKERLPVDRMKLL